MLGLVVLEHYWGVGEFLKLRFIPLFVANIPFFHHSIIAYLAFFGITVRALLELERDALKPDFYFLSLSAINS
jgi:hypothetical protein